MPLAPSRPVSPGAILPPEAHRDALWLDGLIGMLSHDLRTPLSAISGWLFLLESGKLDAEGQKRAVAKIKAAVEEEVQLIDDTVLISRGQAGRLEVDSVSVQIGEPLGAAIAAIRPQAAAKGVALEAGAMPQGANVAGSAPLLRRAFDLLLVHALKATPAGGTISVAAPVAGGEVVIEIRDTGAGFSDAELPWVLDPFRQIPEGTKAAGRGPERGLLLAQVIVAAHRGRLGLASGGANRGEAFAVALPLVATGAARGAAPR